MAWPPNLPGCPGFFTQPPGNPGPQGRSGAGCYPVTLSSGCILLGNAAGPACLLLPLLPRKATDWRQILTELRHLAHITTPLNLAAALKNHLNFLLF